MSTAERTSNEKMLEVDECAVRIFNLHLVQMCIKQHNSVFPYIAQYLIHFIHKYFQACFAKNGFREERAPEFRIVPSRTVVLLRDHQIRINEL